MDPLVSVIWSGVGMFSNDLKSTFRVMWHCWLWPHPQKHQWLKKLCSSDTVLIDWLSPAPPPTPPSPFSVFLILMGDKAKKPERCILWTVSWPWLNIYISEPWIGWFDCHAMVQTPVAVGGHFTGNQWRNQCKRTNTFMPWLLEISLWHTDLKSLEFHGETPVLNLLCRVTL